MNRIELTKNFYLDEFYDVVTYHNHRLAGTLDQLADALDKKLLTALQKIRDYMNEPASINDWWKVYVKHNGDLKKTLAEVKAKRIDQWSGVRFPHSPYFSKGSQHSYTRRKAADVIFSSKDWLPKVQSYVFHNWKSLGITGMEVNVSWLHVDTRPLNPQAKRIFTFDMDSAEPNWKPAA
jgi:hypothetical protein